MATNTASGNDRVPVQVGRVEGRAKSADTKRDKKPAPKDTGTTANVRSGNARVGIQADVIEGGLVIRMGRRA